MDGRSRVMESQPVLWLVVAASVVISAIGQAQPPEPSNFPAHGLGFDLMGVAPGQSARINVLNQAVSPAPEGPAGCRIALQFYDAQGQLLRELIIPRLGMGQSASLDLNRDDFPGSDRLSLRAIMAFGYGGGANPPPQLLQRIATCNIVPSLEIYDNGTGNIRVVMTDARPLPGPPQPVQ